MRKEVARAGHILRKFVGAAAPPASDGLLEIRAGAHTVNRRTFRSSMLGPGDGSLYLGRITMNRPGSLTCFRITTPVKTNDAALGKARPPRHSTINILPLLDGDSKRQFITQTSSTPDFALAHEAVRPTLEAALDRDSDNQCALSRAAMGIIHVISNRDVWFLADGLVKVLALACQLPA